jgi:glycosyltransferase involved in cell wall biosynthesis
VTTVTDHPFELSNVPVTCIVLTLNEAVNLSSALATLTPAQQVIVVDSGSQDGTLDIARQHEVSVLENEWKGFAAQRNWALQHPEVRHDWVLFIDADEQVPAPAWKEIAEFLRDPKGHRAADFRRAVYLFGQRLRHGGFSTARVTRLVHRSYARFPDRLVHEHAVVDGSIHAMSEPLVHHDRKPFEAWLARHNRYSTLEAQARLAASAPDVGGARQIKQWVRKYVWGRLPAKPVLFFLYVYVVRLGFLDGRAGLRIGALYGYQELCIQIKLDELRRA